jgi:hypothetical protein
MRGPIAQIRPYLGHHPRGRCRVVAALGPRAPPTERPAAVRGTTALAYKVASEEIIEAPNGRTRLLRRIVIPASGTQEGVSATLAVAVRPGLAEYPSATVVIAYGYGLGDDTEATFTRGRAAASRDGKGLDAGSGLLFRPDTGQIQIDVLWDASGDGVTDNLEVDLPC